MGAVFKSRFFSHPDLQYIMILKYLPAVYFIISVTKSNDHLEVDYTTNLHTVLILKYIKLPRGRIMNRSEAELTEGNNHR